MNRRELFQALAGIGLIGLVPPIEAKSIPAEPVADSGWKLLSPETGVTMQWGVADADGIGLFPLAFPDPPLRALTSDGYVGQMTRTCVLVPPHATWVVIGVMPTIPRPHLPSLFVPP